MEIVRAALQQAFETDHLYKQGMALKHGLERPKRVELDAAEPATGGQLPVAQAIPERAGARLWPWLASAAIALGSAVGGGAVTATMLRPPTAPVAPAPTPAVAAEEQRADAGLLADLQERGYHLPPPSPKVQP